MLEGPALRLAKRRIILRDSLTLSVLATATVALYVITSFLFGSFAAHRAELARQYAATGRTALSAGQPEHAISDLRVSLSYNPDDTGNHLLFAEALAQAHHTEEATNYFLSLRETRPADGFINLQLARLARQKGDARQAIDYYRSSTLGNWDGDGVTARRQVQLELADYLIQRGDLGGARSQILIASTNAPETADLDIVFGDRLIKANDPTAALGFYRKAAALDPHGFEAPFDAGSIAYTLGRYQDAADMLALALKRIPATERTKPQATRVVELENNTRRILKLSLSADLPPRQRVEHIRTAIPIARARLDGCAAGLASQSTLPPSIQALQARWQAAAKQIRDPLPADDTANQDAVARLIADTEIESAQFCDAPSGDDALLLHLARTGEAR